MADHVIYYQSNFICVMGWELEVIVCVLLVDVKLLGKGLGYIGVGDLGLALRVDWGRVFGEAGGAKKKQRDF